MAWGKRHKKNFVARCLINFIAILVTAKLVHGISIDGWTAALLAALVLGVVNAIIRPVIYILSLPLTVLTLGLFTFVVNALMLLLTASIIPGFAVAGFWVAVLAAIVISVISAIISALLD